jgi:hypothetical protein
MGHYDLSAKERIRSDMTTIKVDHTTLAVETMERYCVAHPDSPVAVRRPKLFFKSGTWIALLGDNIEDGITGFGSSVEAALRAFDLIYRRALQSRGDGRAT